jgi:hypothetical protein
MKIAKFAMIACIAATGFTAVAQENAKQEEKKASAMESLDLSDDQRTEIDALRKDTKEKIASLKADDSMERDAKKAEFKAIKAEKNEALGEILSEEQNAKLKEIKEAKKAKKEETTLEEIAQKQTDKMKEVIELSAEQEEQIYALNLKVANKIDVIKKDDSMTDEKKKEFIKGNKEDKRRALEMILTEDQLATWDAHISSKRKLKTGAKTHKSASE